MDEYSKLSRNASLGVHGYVLVFSVTSKLSLEKIRIINDMLIKLLGNTSDIPRVLVGTMCDVDTEYNESDSVFDMDGINRNRGSKYRNGKSNSNNNIKTNANFQTHNHPYGLTEKFATKNSSNTSSNINDGSRNDNVNADIHTLDASTNSVTSNTSRTTNNTTLSDNYHSSLPSNLLYGPGAANNLRIMTQQGNKVGTSQREVSPEEGQYVADSWGVPYIEVSAKLDLNINSVFETLIKEIEKDSTLIDRENVPSCILL